MDAPTRRYPIWYNPHPHMSLFHSVCLRYETAKKKGDYDEEQQMRENAKQALERYMHYYQRWAENDKARLQVRSKLHFRFGFPIVIY